MLFPNPEFPVIELGYGVSEGAVCPSCQKGTLFNAEDKIRRCDHCFAAHPSMLRSIFTAGEGPERNVYFDQYASLQHYQTAPTVGQSAVALSDFVLDVDRENLHDAASDTLVLLAVLEELAPGQVRLYFSGKKGFHLQVPAQAFGFEASEMLGAAQRRMARSISEATGIELDYTAYSRARLFRLEGSRHSKTGLFKVEINRDLLFDMDALKAYAAEPRPQLNRRPPTLSRPAAELYAVALQEERDFRTEQERSEGPMLGERDQWHSCIKTLLRHGPPAPETRHKTYITLVAYLKTAGLSMAETKDILLPFAETHPATNTTKSPRQRRFEMASDIRSGYSSQNIRFHCQYAMALHVCDATCPLYKPLQS